MNSAPPKINSPAKWLLPGIILGVICVGGGIVIYFFNPSTHSFYPECRFHQLTGLDCPGCGMTRAVYALLHGHFLRAVHDNALLIGGLFWVGGRAGWFWLNQRRGNPNGEFVPAKHLWWLLVVALIFTVLRNLPACAFLYA